MMDTVLRRFRLGTILRYGLEVYGSKAGNAGKPNLQTRIRVFRDSELVLDGKPAPASLENQRDLNRIQLSGAVSIGQGMSPGDYILQIIVIDNANKQKFATQYVQFEVVE